MFIAITHAVSYGLLWFRVAVIESIIKVGVLSLGGEILG